MTSPAAELRAAASRVRELAAAIPEPNYHQVPLWSVVAPMVGRSSLNAVSLAPAGEWIAMFRPEVAEPLAAWLDNAAHWAGFEADEPAPGSPTGHALALARVLNGGAS